MNLVKFVSYRLLRMLFVLWGTVTLTFLVFRVVPGDPARLVAGIQATPEELATIRAAMGLDKPVYLQYVAYFQQLLSGNLGLAWHTQHPVLDDLLIHLPATVELAIGAMGITVAVGIPLGVYSATRKGGIIDQLGRSISTLGIGMPIFWLGLLLSFFFYFELRWLPPPLGQLGIELTPPTTITGLYIID